MAGPFDERRTGLDHVSLAVVGEATLHEWARYLADRELRGADRIRLGAEPARSRPVPVELFALSPDGAAAFGLT